MIKKPCKYCSGSTKIQSEEIDCKTASIGITNNAMQISIYDTCWGSMEAQVGVNYCPMCGRKLVEETVDEYQLMLDL